jgi:hypothetical protein
MSLNLLKQPAMMWLKHLTIVVTRLPDPLRNQNDLQLS